MIWSVLMGGVAGARSMTPLAAVSLAANRGLLPADSGAPAWLGRTPVAVGAATLALLELAGDKLPSAPDRIVPIGLAARVATAGIAGAALAPRAWRLTGAALGAAAAVGAAFPSWRARMAALPRYGQTPSGLVEDAVVVAAAAAIVMAARRE